MVFEEYVLGQGQLDRVFERPGRGVRTFVFGRLPLHP